MDLGYTHGNYLDLEAFKIFESFPDRVICLFILLDDDLRQSIIDAAAQVQTYTGQLVFLHHASLLIPIVFCPDIDGSLYEETLSYLQALPA